MDDNLPDYGLTHALAFDQALADNTPYNHEFYTKNKACLINFVSYYESCKLPNKHLDQFRDLTNMVDSPTQHPLPDYRETRGILKPYLEDETTKNPNNHANQAS